MPWASYSPYGRAILRHEVHLLGDVLSNGWGSAGGCRSKTERVRLGYNLPMPRACGTCSLLCVTSFPSQ